MPNANNICNILMYTMFPSSNAGQQHELKRIDVDLAQIHTLLTNERVDFAFHMVTHRKLKDMKIPMDKNGMSRTDAKRSVLKRLNRSKKIIGVYEQQVAMFENMRSKMEATQLTSNMNMTVQDLKRRMVRVRAIDPEDMVRDMDDIAEYSKELDNSNNVVNDAMVSMWDTDIDLDEVELEEYMQNIDEEDLAIQGHVDRVEDGIDLKQEERELCIEESVVEMEGPPVRERHATALF